MSCVQAFDWTCAPVHILYISKSIHLLLVHSFWTAFQLHCLWLMVSTLPPSWRLGGSVYLSLWLCCGVWNFFCIFFSFFLYFFSTLLLKVWASISTPKRSIAFKCGADLKFSRYQNVKLLFIINYHLLIIFIFIFVSFIFCYSLYFILLISSYIFYHLFLLYVCLPESNESAWGEYLCEAQ